MIRIYAKTGQSRWVRVLLKDTHSAGITVVDRHRETRKQWDEDARSPWNPVVMGTDDSVDEGVADFVLDCYIVDYGSRTWREHLAGGKSGRRHTK